MWIRFALAAVLATAYVFWAMTRYQRLTMPKRVALIYTLEPVWGAIFSVWLLNEKLASMAWAGGTLIVAGMVFAEVWPMLIRKKVTWQLIQPLTDSSPISVVFFLYNTII